MNISKSLLFSLCFCLIGPQEISCAFSSNKKQLPPLEKKGKQSYPRWVKVTAVITAVTVIVALIIAFKIKKDIDHKKEIGFQFDGIWSYLFSVSISLGESVSFKRAGSLQEFCKRHSFIPSWIPDGIQIGQIVRFIRYIRTIRTDPYTNKSIVEYIATPASKEKANNYLLFSFDTSTRDPLINPYISTKVDGEEGPFADYHAPS